MQRTTSEHTDQFHSKQFFCIVTKSEKTRNIGHDPGYAEFKCISGFILSKKKKRKFESKFLGQCEEPQKQKEKVNGPPIRYSYH